MFQRRQVHLRNLFMKYLRLYILLNRSPISYCVFALTNRQSVAWGAEITGMFQRVCSLVYFITYGVKLSSRRGFVLRSIKCWLVKLLCNQIRYMARRNCVVLGESKMFFLLPGIADPVYGGFYVNICGTRRGVVYVG